MEILESKTTEAVLYHHLEAFVNADLDELLKDYTEESEVWTNDGVLAGIDAISQFYRYVFTILPKNQSQLTLKQKIVKDDRVFITWMADSPFINIPMGNDGFLINEGKIVWQIACAHIVQKNEDNS